MWYVPFNYEQINIAAGTYNPSMVKSYNNATFAYWQRSLFQRACSTLKFTLPDNWKGNIRDFFYFCLFNRGFVIVSENAKFGKFFQPGTLSGYNFYYQPTKALIANPLYDAELEISKDCEILKLTPDYYGAWDIISYYAEKLSALDNAINMSIVNNKYAFMIAAKTKAAAAAIKKMLDKVNRGEPAVIYDGKLVEDDPMSKSEPWQIWNRDNLKSSYLTTDQLVDFQTILNNFDSEVGIPTLPYQKKERMISDEAGYRAYDGTSRCTVWYETLKSSMDVVNGHYDLGLDVEMRFDPEKEVNADVDS